MTPDLKPPEGTPQLWPSAIMFCIAAASGLVSWWGKVKAGEARPFNVLELLGEVITSGVTGLLVAWLVTGLGVNLFLAFAAAGIAGHMGTRVIFLIERYAERKLLGRRK